MTRLAPDTPAWVYSPDPLLERRLHEIRAKYPPLFPDGTGRTLTFLEKLGQPQQHLPPVFHVAGTNGKGSVLAFLQAIFESGGLAVHKYISPHLVRFEERILLHGKMIGSEELLKLIDEADALNGDAPLSFFEFFTGISFLHFSRHPVDAVLLETGLGGANDATNTLQGTHVPILTRISFDHARILGPDISDIARHKAGIMRKGRPVVVAPQKDEAVKVLFKQIAADTGAHLYAADANWFVTRETGGFRYRSAQRDIYLPMPKLPGAHQIENAGAAIAAIECSLFSHLLTPDILSKAMHRVDWPARLQRLTDGNIVRGVPAGVELWVDGAHNDSGAETLAAQIAAWGDDMPLHLVTAFKRKKDYSAFYAILAGKFASVTVTGGDSAAPMMPTVELAAILQDLGYANISGQDNVGMALQHAIFQCGARGRILVAGSLYLAGDVLKINGEGSLETTEFLGDEKPHRAGR